jgi:hypothetical protein
MCDTPEMDNCYYCGKEVPIEDAYDHEANCDQNPNK